MPSITSRGQSLYFEDRGQGDCVVLGHSFLCNGEMWEYQVPRLAESYRVVNADLRGHGRSGPIAGPIEAADLVDDVLAILDHIGIERAVWAGLSIGGMVALRAALSHPDRVAGLILLDTHAGEERLYRKIKYRTLATGAKLLGLRPFLPAVTPLMFGATTRLEKPQLVEHWREIIAAMDVESLDRVLGALLGRESLVDRLGEIEMPTLVMVGEEDRALSPSCSRQIAAGIAGAELVEIPSCGHLAALEQPEIVTGAMLEFLNRPPAPIRKQ
jgi:pimeloyl-ACP methyl ester carboxylesterase